MYSARPLSRVAGAILAAALVATTLTAPADPSLASVTPASCQGGWLSTPNPLTGTRGDVLDLSVGPAGTWMVGIATSASWTPTPMTATWDGTQWVTVPLPQPGSTGVLSSVTPRGSSELWAVGELDGARTNPLIERYSQGSWHTVSTPALPNGASLTHIAAWGTGRAWAVGFAAPSNGPRPLAMRWNGTAWQVVSPAVSADSALASVGGIVNTDTWAVGWIRQATGFRPLLEHWNGTSWTRVKPVSVGGPDAVLTGVAVRSASDAWAVGYQGTQNSWSPLVLHWDGVTWSSVDAPVPPVAVSISLLRSVALTPTGIIAAGTVWDESLSATRSMVARWDGIAWDTAVDIGGEASGDLVAIGSDSATTWVVGRGNKTGLTIRTCTPDGAGGTASAGRPGFGKPLAPMKNPEQDETEMQPRPATIAGRPSNPGAPVAPPPGLEVRDLATEAGIGINGNTYGGNAADLNGDGWRDLVIGQHGVPLWVGLDVDGHFQRALQGQIPSADRHGCTIGDVDGDGRPDIACVQGAAHGMAVKRNELFLAPLNGTVVNTATPWGIADPFGRGRQVAMFDANHDGLLDIYVANDPSRIDGLPSLNHLYLNAGNERFVPAPEAGLDLPHGGICLAPSDLDGDGWTDLVLCRFVPLDGASGIRVFHNSAGHFSDITAQSGITPLGETSAAVADMNGDGQPDIVQVASNRLRVALQDQGTFHTGLDITLVGGRSVGIGDADGNGTKDLYVVTAKIGGSNATDLMLLNSGDGITFTSISIPQTTVGSGDSAVPIDYDQNGKMDFAVLNGYSSAVGPLQLIAFGPPWPASYPTPTPSPTPTDSPTATPSPTSTPAPTVTPDPGLLATPDPTVPGV